MNLDECIQFGKQDSSTLKIFVHSRALWYVCIHYTRPLIMLFLKHYPCNKVVVNFEG